MAAPSRAIDGSSSASARRSQGNDPRPWDKVQLYTPAQLRAQADVMIGPWLVAQARARIAERNSQVTSKEERTATQGLLLNESHAQNGAVK